MDNLVVVNILGKDRPGLVADITTPLADNRVNIVDIDETTRYGLFSIFMLLDLSTSKLGYDKLKKILQNIVDKLSMSLLCMPLSEFTELKRPKIKQIQTITVLGADKPGIVAGISNELRRQNINIERIKMIAREELFAMEMLVGYENPVNLNLLRKALRQKGDSLGVDIIVQPEDTFREKKKLIVFDMDSTIVDAEVIDELAKVVGIGDKVSEITARGMRGEIDFRQGLRERVKLLKNTPISVLDEIANNLRLTPGSEELILTLKEMGCKVALISGGFTYFTNKIGSKLGFDYTFGNELEIKNGKLTGRIKGKIVDKEVKGKIIEELAKKEGFGRGEIVAVGDGANDQIMLKNAGLGIAFNAKEILREVADGTINKNNLKGLLYCLGFSESEIRRKRK